MQEIHKCALCECPLPLGEGEVVCGACVKEWQTWGELRADVETARRTDWTRGVNHAKMLRRPPISRAWQFEVGEINDYARWAGDLDAETDAGSESEDGDE